MAMYAPPLRYKREVLAAHRRDSRRPREARHNTSSDSLGTIPFSTSKSTSNTTHSGRRVLRSSGPNYSEPSVFIAFLHLDWANPSYTRVLTLWVYAGALRHPAVGLHTTTAIKSHDPIFSRKKNSTLCPDPSLIPRASSCTVRSAGSCCSCPQRTWWWVRRVPGTSSQEAGVNNQLVYGVDQIKRSGAACSLPLLIGFFFLILWKFGDGSSCAL